MRRRESSGCRTGGGQREPHIRPRDARAARPAVASVRAGDRLDDRKTETAARSDRASSARLNRSKARLANPCREAGTLVDHMELDRTRCPRRTCRVTVPVAVARARCRAGFRAPARATGGRRRCSSPARHVARSRGGPAVSAEPRTAPRVAAAWSATSTHSRCATVARTDRDCAIAEGPRRAGSADRSRRRPSRPRPAARLRYAVFAARARARS